MYTITQRDSYRWMWVAVTFLGTCTALEIKLYTAFSIISSVIDPQHWGPIMLSFVSECVYRQGDKGNHALLIFQWISKFISQEKPFMFARSGFNESCEHTSSHSEQYEPVCMASSSAALDTREQLIFLIISMSWQQKNFYFVGTNN